MCIKTCSPKTSRLGFKASETIKRSFISNQSLLVQNDYERKKRKRKKDISIPAYNMAKHLKAYVMSKKF